MDRITVITALVFGILIFLVLRELWCWYWKINKRLGLQEKQLDTLQELVTSQNETNQHLKELTHQLESRAETAEEAC